MFFVVAGQNKLTWDEIDSGWSDPACLEQHLIGGLSEKDARAFLTKCGVTEAALQDVILTSCKELDPSGEDDRQSIGYHCFSLGLHADIASGEIAQGHTPDLASFALRPGDWDALTARFLKSLPDDGVRVWVKRLASTPRFDERAGRAAWSAVDDAAQDAAWESPS